MATGFMSGFGSAFSQSFNQASAQRAEKEKDMFQLQYKDYITRRDETAKTKSEQAKAVRLAKQIVAETNQPSDSWGDAYNMLNDGVDYGTVLKKYQENVANIKPATTAANDVSGPAQPEEDLTKQASSKVDAQMAQSGMAPPAEGQGLFGNLGEALTPNGPQRQARDQQRRYEQIASVSGATPEEVQGTMSGSSPEPVAGSQDYQIEWSKKPAETEITGSPLERVTQEMVLAEQSGDKAKYDLAKVRYDALKDLAMFEATLKARSEAEAAGVYSSSNQGIVFNPDGTYKELATVREVPGPNGQPQYVNPVTGQPVEGTFVPMSEDLQKEWGVIAEEVTKPRVEYTNQLNSLVDSTRAVGEISDIVKTTPQVLTSVGSISKWASEMAREGYTAMQMITADKKGLISEEGFQKMMEAEKAMVGALGPQVKTLEGQTALFEAKLNILAYRLAMQENGGNSRAMSNADFDRIKGTILNTSDPVIFLENLGRDLVSRKSSADQIAKTLLTENPRVTTFKDKLNLEDADIFGKVSTFDDFIMDTTDPYVLKGLELMKGSGTKKNSELESAGPVPEGMDPEIWKHISPEDRKLWQ